MGNTPVVYLYCAPCDARMPLPYRRSPMFYLDHTHLVKVSMPRCLGFCATCQQYCPVEDFSESVAILRRRFWTLEQQQSSARLNFWQRYFKLRFWPRARRESIELNQRITEALLLVQIRQMPGRQPRCLKCASAEITAYPHYPYRDSGFLAQVPEKLVHHCGKLLQPRYMSFGSHVSTTALYYNMAGEALL